MRCRRVVLPCVGPCGSAVIAAIVSNEAVLLRNSLTLWLPEAEVEEGAVHKNDWSAGSLVEVGEIDAIHMQLPRLQGFSSPRLEGEATADRDEDRQPEGASEKDDGLLSWFGSCSRTPMLRRGPRRSALASTYGPPLHGSPLVQPD